MKTNGWKMMAVAGFAALVGMMWCQVLAPRDAVGYPAGAAVSYGANPVFSVGGNISMSASAGGTSTVDEVLGLSGQDVVITDVVLTTSRDYAVMYCATVLAFSDGTDTVAEFGLVSPNIESVGLSEAVVANFNSGIRLAGGDTLTITATSRVASSTFCSGENIHYTLSGYYAEP